MGINKVMIQMKKFDRIMIHFNHQENTMNNKIIHVTPLINSDITEFDDCLITAIEWKEQAEWDKKHLHSESDEGQARADQRIADADRARTSAEQARRARIVAIRNQGIEPVSMYR
jgi:hypothetical protein